MKDDLSHILIQYIDKRVERFYFIATTFIILLFVDMLFIDFGHVTLLSVGFLLGMIFLYSLIGMYELFKYVIVIQYIYLEA